MRHQVAGHGLLTHLRPPDGRIAADLTEYTRHHVGTQYKSRFGDGVCSMHSVQAANTRMAPTAVRRPDSTHLASEAIFTGNLAAPAASSALVDCTQYAQHNHAGCGRVACVDKVLRRLGAVLGSKVSLIQ